MELSTSGCENGVEQMWIKEGQGDGLWNMWIIGWVGGRSPQGSPVIGTP